MSKKTISAITDRVVEGMAEWQSLPLDPVYAVVFIDAINVKIREGQVANRPVYLALGVSVDGERDVLGLWAGEHGDGEGAKYWLRVLSEIKNRGVKDVCMLVCDGLKGLPEAVNTVWERAIVQTCIVHLLRNSFRYASKRDWLHESGGGVLRRGARTRRHDEARARLERGRGPEQGADASGRWRPRPRPREAGGILDARRTRGVVWRHRGGVRAAALARLPVLQLAGLGHAEAVLRPGVGVAADHVVPDSP